MDALQRQVIACASLDVYDTGPLPADHPLRSLDNALLTPHIAYVSDRLYQDAIADIAAFFSGSHIRVIG
jgi:phosphoglycerate dehydrogenase-like enzyme